MSFQDPVLLCRSNVREFIRITDHVCFPHPTAAQGATLRCSLHFLQQSWPIKLQTWENSAAGSLRSVRQTVQDTRVGIESDVVFHTNVSTSHLAKTALSRSTVARPCESFVTTRSSLSSSRTSQNQ